MELPQTLHGQLYLLSYNRKRRRFDYECGSYHPARRFEFALRAAMLTDLCLTGHIADNHGVVRRILSQHGDALLQAVVNRAQGRSWSQLVLADGPVCQEVHDQLVRQEWVRGRRQRMMGMVTGHCEVHDDEMVAGVVRRVTEGLHDVLADRPVDPRVLATGLIAIQAQLPVVSGFLDRARDRNRLHALTDCAIEPIVTLRREALDYLKSSVGSGM
jgi:hypothetical protein